jgi:hypothetical protein
MAAGGVLCFSVCLIVSMLAGCGFDGIAAELPDLVAGLSLSDLEAIQDDERLTDDEKREQIREAVGAPETDSGDRLVEFLLTFTVP